MFALVSASLQPRLGIPCLNHYRDFYVTLGESEHRAWEDCRRYKFISAGQGRRFSSPLRSLFPGARVFVLIPGTGYVGVGVVRESAVPVKDFKVQIDGQEIEILNAKLEATKMAENADDLDKCEYLVRVDWIKEVDKTQAYWEKGLFANPNIACRMRNRFTLERLTQHFELDD